MFESFTREQLIELLTASIKSEYKLSKLINEGSNIKVKVVSMEKITGGK